MAVSRKMISISMIVDKHQYYTVMVLDSQAWSPRIITNLPLCAEIHGPKNMASKVSTRNLKLRAMAAGAENMIVDRRYSPILIELVMVPDSQAWSPRIITNLPRFMAQRTWHLRSLLTT